VDTTVTEWSTSHADLHWGNLTAPTLYLLDWDDWGLAPRGNDAACLWASALAVPEVAARVHTEFHDDLDSRAGKIARLWVCSNILRMADRRADAHALAEPAASAADQLVKDLR
jgi:thiamine kinase-like enzyme